MSLIHQGAEAARSAGKGRGTRGWTRFLTAAAVALSALVIVPAAGAATGKSGGSGKPKNPIEATVFSPRPGSVAGSGGVAFIVDIALDATKPRFNKLLSAEAGYVPFFNDPAASTFHPGPDPGAPGLVVLLSSTPTMPGTPFQGPRTNLAGLVQINGVASVEGKAETWNTWQPGKALFGTGTAKLTVFVVRGTAPAIVPGGGAGRISNVVNVPFKIGG